MHEGRNSVHKEGGRRKGERMSNAEGVGCRLCRLLQLAGFAAESAGQHEQGRGKKVDLASP